MELLTDGLANALTGMGATGDRQTGTAYRATALSDGELRAIFESSSLGAKVVEVLAFDATREWRAWSGTPEEIAAIEIIETRLRLSTRVREALIHARLFGGAAIYASDGRREPSEPLLGPIEGLRVFGAADLKPSQERDEDLSSPTYGEPLSFELNVGCLLYTSPSPRD